MKDLQRVENEVKSINDKPITIVSGPSKKQFILNEYFLDMIIFQEI